MFVGLLLHLQRSECVPVAINANVSSVPKTIAFETPEDDTDIFDDLSDLSSRVHKEGSHEKIQKDSEDDIFGNNNEKSSDETEKMILSQTMIDQKVRKLHLFLDQFHDQMDWYHVLNAHSQYSKKMLLLL